MKRFLSLFLSVTLLFLCIAVCVPSIRASAKVNESRTIAIVFDNSGSMYDVGDQAWCRATYAMEVFASMLNAGDILQIYPMHPITVGNKEYSMSEPFQITDSSQSYLIRDIYTNDAGGTPIESIDCAVEGLNAIQTGKKYLIVLTDGGTFSKNGYGLSKAKTKKELDDRIQANAGPAMTVMYLGIGSDACEPTTQESDYFVKRKAVNTADVLSMLTDMCNLVFGRDTLPRNRISGNTIDFDISLSKLIVFVQGENISDLKVKSIDGSSVGTLISSQQTKYSTKGAADYNSVPDTSLQGMIVTYSDCAAGRCTVEYSGTATSIEVYYEPDADLEFVFTDSEGNTVDPNALYAGEYKVSFGLKDAKTGQLISSDLLGRPKYQGNYYINGKAIPITCDGFSGSVDIPLKMGETFKADLTVTYLSGYTITKNSSDFGWPDMGIQITPRPAGQLTLKVTGGDAIYYRGELQSGAPYTVTAFYEGKQLKADEFKLELSDNSGNAEFKLVPEGDHYKAVIQHRDPNSPENTQVGSFTINANATYSSEGSEDAHAKATIEYRIDALRPAGGLQLEITGGQDKYSLLNLEGGKNFIAKVYYEGSLLTGDALKQVVLKWAAENSNAELTSVFAEDHYELSLHYKDPENPQNTVCGDCAVPISASYTLSGHGESYSESVITYNISEDYPDFKIDLYVPEDYIVISKIEEYEEFVISLKLNGTPLSPEEFSAATLHVDCGGIEYTLTPDEQNSRYLIKLHSKDGISEGKYEIKINASYTDSIGRTVQSDGASTVTLSTLPLWVKWAIGLLILLILIIIIWIILHIKVLPTCMHTTRSTSSMNFDGDDVTGVTNFSAEVRKKSARMQAQYAGRRFGVSMDVRPGKESYLYKGHKRRSAEVKVASVKSFGPAKIQDVLIGSTKYVVDEHGKLVPALPNQKPFMLTNGMMVKYSGVIEDAGIDKDFEVTSRLNFKKN